MPPGSTLTWRRLWRPVDDKGLPPGLPPLPRPEYTALWTERLCGLALVGANAAISVGVTHLLVMSNAVPHTVRLVVLGVSRGLAASSLACFAGLTFIDPGTIERTPQTCLPLPDEVAAALRTKAPLPEFNHRTDDGREYCVRCLVWRPPRASAPPPSPKPAAPPRGRCATWRALCCDYRRFFFGAEGPLPAHHCRVCGRCARDFDHHCSSLGACITARNMPLFKGLVLLASLSSAFAALVALPLGIAYRLPPRAAIAVGLILSAVAAGWGAARPPPARRTPARGATHALISHRRAARAARSGWCALGRFFSRSLGLGNDFF